MAIQIIELSKADWQGHLLPFRYTADTFFDVEITQNGCNFVINLTEKPLDVPYIKALHDSDALFQHWVEQPIAWGVVQDGELLAAIETAVEGWANRLIVTELWVDESLRRKGVATALMDKAIQRARDEGRRAVVLETQSCNPGAIRFYLNYGYMLIGFDTCAYQNNDVQRREVRLDFGVLLTDGRVD